MTQLICRPGFPAIFSPDRGYRYTLWRENKSRSTPGEYVMFIGLNPSTADERTNDPTLTRVQGFANFWGYHSVVMTNLFAFRATKPADMKRAKKPIGEDNDSWLTQCALSADKVICAWGNTGQYLQRDEDVVALLNRIGVQLYVFDLNRNGTPKHPLFLPANLKPIPWHGY